MRIDKLIKKIMEAKQLAKDLGRWKTYHYLDDAERVCGNELSNILTGKNKIGKIK